MSKCLDFWEGESFKKVNKNVTLWILSLGRESYRAVQMVSTRALEAFRVRINTMKKYRAHQIHARGNRDKDWKNKLHQKEHNKAKSQNLETLEKTLCACKLLVKKFRHYFFGTWSIIPHHVFSRILKVFYLTYFRLG